MITNGWPLVNANISPPIAWPINPCFGPIKPCVLCSLTTPKAIGGRMQAKNIDNTAADTFDMVFFPTIPKIQKKLA